MAHSFSQILPAQFDILVVGAGAAGLYAALCLPDRFRVGLITKDRLKTGSSEWAQGGIAAAIDPSDSPQLHVEDTLKAGAGLCDRKAVQFLANNAAASIESLIKAGVAFDRKGDTLAMTLEAAHSRPRVLHSADTTGRAIVDTLAARILERSNIQVVPQAFALSLWLHPQTGYCQGISLLVQNQIIWVKAAAVILATGGGGQVFAQTTNPAVSTGDGVAMAWRAGAVLRDLEFFQFHPTALTQPGAPRFLISEAVRGEGAHLIDEVGYRFAFESDPAGELAARDVVSRAIFAHLEKRSGDPACDRVYLDLRPIDPDRIRHRFPKILQVCQTWGIDAFKQPIPVAPAAHYWMGGIATDLASQTSIPGLYAIGETASTGVHGANRLASNSLLECLVFAAQLSEIEIVPDGTRSDCPVNCFPSSIAVTEDWQTQIDRSQFVRQSLPRLMWQNAGVYRHGDGLRSALEQVKDWREELVNFPASQLLFNLAPGQTVLFETPSMLEQLQQVAETLNLLEVGYLILKSAAFRTESRGGHYRTDYPQSSSQWQVHTLVQHLQDADGEESRWWTSL